MNALAGLLSLSLALGTFEESAPRRAEYERGPVSVSLALSPGAVRLSDQPVLRFEVVHDPDVAVEVPVLAGELGGFAVVSTRKPREPARDGRIVDVVEVELEPLSSGKLTLPAFDFACVDRRAATLVEHSAGLEFTVSTEPLTIEVESLIEGDAPTLDELAPALAPLEVEVTRRMPWRAISAILAVVGLLLLAAWFLRRGRKRAVAMAPPPTAEELARLEFLALVDADPYGKGDLASFYSELTLIVRRYIERTKGVAAPEQTTEEFLREMRQHAAFDATSRERLRSFLESADLVKFAGMRPAEADVEESFRRGQEFTEQREPIPLRTRQEVAR